MSDAHRFALRTKDIWRILVGIMGLLVLLALIGASMPPYRKPSDRAVCTHQLNTLHKVAVSHANMEKLEPGTLLPSEIVLSYLEEEPKCPTHDLPYLYLKRVPLLNQPYAICLDPAEGEEHNHHFRSQLEQDTKTANGRMQISD